MELNFLISIPKFFFKFDRIYLFIISLLAMMSNLSLYGQLEEISRIVPSHIVQMEKINNQFILIGRSDTYSQNYVPDGMAVLLDKSMMEMEVSFRFREKNGNLTRWIKGEILKEV
jgi:hypothetical protein